MTCNGCYTNGKSSMRALVPCIIDSCQQCEQITQTFEVAAPDIPTGIEGCGSSTLSVGSIIPVKQCGNLTAQVVKTENDCNNIATTVLFSLPIAFLQCDNCALVPYSLATMTDLKTFSLCGSDCSSFAVLGSEIQSLTAVVTELASAATDQQLKVMVSMTVKVYVAQTVAKEVMLPILSNVKVGTCNNGCLNSLPIGANNILLTGTGCTCTTTSNN